MRFLITLFSFMEKSLTEWLELFQKSNKLPYGPINDMKGPSVSFESIEKISMLRHAAPLLGEHTQSILQSELNYTNEQLHKFIHEKIMQ
ncbi:unnamed protein product [Adineta steineri]|uniref:Uncharacterized protein n=1 Tax=Adineta steineri TaxID=433720 RepID=A0A813TJC8_9BILA|nr:unnamed protein product [Adineta steineri]